MQKITFEDLPSTATPLNAANMNAIQTNAENAIDEVKNNSYDLGMPSNDVPINSDLNDLTTPRSI